jgi:hypothetical protein
MKSNEIKHDINEWTDEVENILKCICERAQIWRILNINSHDHFKKKYYFLMIPVIILSSITGSLNLALGSLNSKNDTIINLIIGFFGILISILSTLNNMFSFQKRKDEHYRYSKEWYKIHRLIITELSLEKSKRNNVNMFFNFIINQVENIFENQPNIRKDTINKFLKKYKKKQFDIDIPEILSIKKTFIYKDNTPVNFQSNYSNHIIEITPTNSDMSGQYGVDMNE